MDEIKVTHIELHFIEDLGFTEFMDFPLRHMYGSDGMVRIPVLERCQCCVTGGRAVAASQPVNGPYSFSRTTK